ncbi:hypothetical protein [Deinococcus radiotolerans]|uniref:Uncharacterized protein n=1 Tax=Deinococcus radiotolerans TaxID=1309407 RepID=A0ABQ2FQW0_9DEIO|nr:hypothetical protein [Deinococcus radiotolerans]GGL17796.1 hypothetical protein GCM10010844_40810 [Deinococcus radiotolerans]
MIAKLALFLGTVITFLGFAAIGVPVPWDHLVPFLEHLAGEVVTLTVLTEVIRALPKAAAPTPQERSNPDSPLQDAPAQR